MKEKNRIVHGVEDESHGMEVNKHGSGANLCGFGSKGAPLLAS